MRVPQPTPPAGAALGCRRPGAAFDAGRVRIVRGGKGFGDHLVGLVDRPFHTGCDDGLAGEAVLVLDADIGGEDDGVGRRDRRRIERRAAGGSLRLDVQRGAGLLGRGGQRVGGHVGVRDTGRACGDREQRLGPLRSGFLCGSGLIGVQHTVDERDHVVGRRRLPQRLHEVLAHQGAREAGQQLHVLRAAGLRGGDQEGQIGGSVGCAEIDGRIQSREADRGGVDVR